MKQHRIDVVQFIATYTKGKERSMKATLFVKAFDIIVALYNAQ